MAIAPLPKCPICGKPAAQATRPFCSPRCAQVDLGRWFTESYRVPSAEPEEGGADEISGEKDHEAG